ncbi:hypothetical protein QE152_g40351 [Popillia japonica]|uniref:Uncharacterized protein n=1 Tax=Popillia japonica TaxID=7064 RepID=A0AAW1HS82_POPJA
MELEAQPVPLPLYNYDNVTKPITFVRHNILFGGSNKRVLIVGPSGCGKTNALIALYFLEDEYIGEYLPETPVAPKDDEDESLGEFEDDSRSLDLEKSETPVAPKDDEDESLGEFEDDSRSLDLEKSMAHALSLLQSKPSKSIIANKSLNKTGFRKIYGTCVIITTKQTF